MPSRDYLVLHSITEFIGSSIKLNFVNITGKEVKKKRLRAEDKRIKNCQVAFRPSIFYYVLYLYRFIVNNNDEFGVVNFINLHTAVTTITRGGIPVMCME